MITIQLQVLCCCNCSVCLILFLCASGPCLPTLPAIPPNPHPGMHPSRIKSPSHQTTNFHISPRCCVNTPVVCFFAGEYKHFVIYQELFSSCAFVILVIFLIFWGGSFVCDSILLCSGRLFRRKTNLCVITVQIHFESTTKDKPWKGNCFINRFICSLMYFLLIVAVLILNVFPTTLAVIYCDRLSCVWQLSSFLYT